MNECQSCGFNDVDYGCTCPHSDKWYACPIENKKPENVKAIKEYAEEYGRKRRQKMNKRQAKKKRKKEQQRADYYVALEELPDIARKIGEGIREALDKISEALSEINVEEVYKQIKAEKEAEDEVE